MRQWMQALGIAGLVILFGLFSCRQPGGQPRAGETVTPRLQGPVHWTAGATGQLGVRLYAEGGDPDRARLLDFSAIPSRVNPVANIAFYGGDQPLSSLEVALSHRC
jgi:hypothetical protein